MLSAARRTVRLMMTNPGLYDPIADIAARVGGVTLPRELLKIISKYADGLSLVAAHGIRVTHTQPDKTTYRVYWVSAASLVTLDYEVGQVDGADAALANGRVRSLASVRVEIEAVVKSSSQMQAVERTVWLHFPGESEPVQLPDPLSLPLDDAAKTEQVDTFLDELLRVLDHRPSGPGT
jgi:hypothetical protein